MPATLVGSGLVVAAVSLFSRGFFTSTQRTALTRDSIARMRKEYSEEGLEEDNLSDKWLEDAVNSKLLEPNAMCLSTVFFFSFFSPFSIFPCSSFLNQGKC